MSVDGAGQGAPGANVVFRTVWDGGGTDTYDFSRYGAEHQLVVDLAPGGWSDVDADSNAQAAFLGGGPNGGFARGQVFNALLFRGDPRSLIENAVGGAGDDRIIGNRAGNLLSGSAGNDTLVGGAGDDALDGGVGTDAAGRGAAGFRGAGLAPAGGGGLVIASAAGTDTVVGVEAVFFADGRLVLDPDDPAAQVARLYEAALGRPPDQAGLNHWIEAVRSGQPLQELARGFLGAPEFAERFGPLADRGAFVDRLYLNVLDRPGDAGGRAFWVGTLDAGAPRAQALAAFSEGAENRAGTAALVENGIWDRSEAAAAVARLYDTVLGRRPDAAGLDGWRGAVESGQASLPGVAEALAASPEFRAAYGGLDNRQFVSTLYRNTLDRAGDAGGLDYWSALLGSGAARSAVALAFSESPEHVVLTAADIQSDDPGQFGILFA